MNKLWVYKDDRSCDSFFLNHMYKCIFDMVLLCTFITMDTFSHIKCAFHVSLTTFTSGIAASIFNNMQPIGCCNVSCQCKGCACTLLHHKYKFFHLSICMHFSVQFIIGSDKFYENLMCVSNWMKNSYK